MWSFIRHRLDLATRIGEALFGLIMALGITGAVRISTQEATNRELLFAVLGCNVAWGVVDAVMYVMLQVFERARKARVIAHVQNAATDEAAIDYIRLELADRIEPLTSPEEREQLYRWVLDIARRSRLETPLICRDEILGGIAVGLLVLLITLPIVVPFLVFSDPYVAVRASNLIALALLVALGWRWGIKVGANPLQISAAVTGIGLLMVLITIMLGG